MINECSFEGSVKDSEINLEGNVSEKEILWQRGKFIRHTINRSHPSNCKCEDIPKASFDSWRALWFNATTCAEKSALVGQLIGKRCHGYKLDKVIYEFYGLYVSRNCLVVNLGLSENALSKYSKQKTHEDNRGKHKNRANKIQTCAIEESHYTKSINLANASIRLKDFKNITELYKHVKKIAVLKLPYINFPSKVWFYKWFYSSYKNYKFTKLRTDVCIYLKDASIEYIREEVANKI